MPRAMQVSPGGRLSPPPGPPHLSQVLQSPLGLCVGLGLPQLQQALHLSVLELSMPLRLFVLFLHVLHVGGPTPVGRTFWVMLRPSHEGAVGTERVAAGNSRGHPGGGACCGRHCSWGTSTEMSPQEEESGPGVGSHGCPPHTRHPAGSGPCPWLAHPAGMAWAQGLRETRGTPGGCGHLLSARAWASVSSRRRVRAAALR